ncbi:MAG: AMP-binding protein [Firmicutes bacterium]|nr:AMP-binding protein [Bacillota bacterium]
MSEAREKVMHRLLERQAAKYGERTYMYFEGHEYSFKDVNDQANRAAAGLQKLGVVKGDKVAVVMGNCPEYLFLHFGLAKLGAVGVPVNIFHKGEIVNYMIDHSDAVVMVMQSPFIDRLAGILAKSTKIHSVVILEGEGEGGDERLGDRSATVAMVKDQVSGFGKRATEWQELTDNDGGYSPADVLWSDPFLILYTSGTTGLSKGVLLPHNLVYCQGEHFCDWVLGQEMDENDCVYNPKPFFHALAWHAGVSPSLLTGARMVLTRRFSASRHWDDIKRYHCTYSTAGGAVLPILQLAEPKPDDADNPLKVIFGGPSSARFCAEFEPRFGLKTTEFYGSTEVGAPTMNSLAYRKAGSCGKIHPDYLVKIVDEDGVEVGVNMPGEVLVRPLKPFTMMLGYYKMPEQTNEAWKDLWFHTGDNARLDEEGYLHFVDRKKDALRRRGENVSSYEVEVIINSHPAVLESAVYAVPSDLADDDDIMVSLTLKPGGSLLPEELIAYCEERMAYFMVPRYVRFMDELPKNAVPRIEKYKLRAAGITPDSWDRDKAGYNLKR